MTQIQDIHALEAGVRDFEGIPIDKGFPLCPGCPSLADPITRPAHLSVGPLRARATREKQLAHEQRVRDLEDFDAKVTIRSSFTAAPHQGASSSAKDQGKSRWVCPARAGKVRCPSVAYSMNFPDDRPLVENPPDYETPRRCCTQQTFTVPGAALEKLHQQHVWGTKEWRESFARRTHIEGIFGNLRHPDTENLSSGYCRVRGIVKNTFMIAVLVVSANIRLTRVRAKRVGETSDPLTVPFEENFGFEELDANGEIRLYQPKDSAEPPKVRSG